MEDQRLSRPRYLGPFRTFYRLSAALLSNSEIDTRSFRCQRRGLVQDMLHVEPQSITQARIDKQRNARVCSFVPSPIDGFTPHCSTLARSQGGSSQPSHCPFVYSELSLILDSYRCREWHVWRGGVTSTGGFDYPSAVRGAYSSLRLSVAVHSRQAARVAVATPSGRVSLPFCALTRATSRR